MNILGSQDNSFVNKIILPGNGRKYSGKNSKGLLWLCNAAGKYFPNHFIRKPSKSVILYSHGNGGSLGDFKSIVTFYATWFSMSVFAVEYPGYGPAEGEPSESAVNDNIYTAFQYLLQLGYPAKNIVLMGYSIGTGPTIHLASSLCHGQTPPAAVVTIAAFLSICDIVRDLRGSILVSMLADAIDNRWNSAEVVHEITCPILFIHGMFDDVIPYQHSQRLYASCSSDKKFIRLCENATHTHFHEPVDTIEPIAMFLAEMVRPREDIVIFPVAQVHFMCPQSVAERESQDQEKIISSAYTEVTVDASGKMKEEKTCVSSLLGWVVDLFGHHLTSGDSEEDAEADGSSGRGARAREREAPGSRFEEVSGKYSSPLRGANGEVVLPGSDSSQAPASADRPRLEDEDDRDETSVENSYSQEDLTVHLAIEALKGYYDALNSQDIFAAVSALDDNVCVVFPEEARNWTGASTAVGKFRHMFNTLPGFQGSLQIDNSQLEEDGSVTIYAHCHFQCNKTKYYSARDMVYCVKDEKIFMIEHRP